MIIRMIFTQGLNNPQNGMHMIIFKLQAVYCSSCHSNSLVEDKIEKETLCHAEEIA